MSKARRPSVFAASHTPALSADNLSRAKPHQGGLSDDTTLEIQLVAALHALHRQSQQLEAALMVAQVGTWEWDFTNDTLVPDEHFAQLIGLNLETAPGLPRFDFAAMIHPDDRERLGTAANGAIASGGTFDCSYRIITAGGKVHHILARGTSELASNGQPGSFRGAIVDLTERHDTEAALRANQELLAVAQRAGSIGTFEWNIITEQLIITPEFEAL